MDDATYVNHMDHRFMIPAGAQIMYTGNQFAGYTMAGNTITVNEMMAAATAENHSYYDKTVGATVGAIATPNVANIGEKAGMAAAAESMNETYVMNGGRKFMIPTGAQILYGNGEKFAGYTMAGG
jgi:hypothetical protein